MTICCNSTRAALVITVAFLCSCQRLAPQKQDQSPTLPRIAVAKLDGGPLTTYDYDAKGRTKPVGDTSLRRSFIILNDPNCPLQITSFGFRTEASDRTLEEVTGARLTYLVDFSLMPRSSITAWELHDLVFDTLNRFLWREIESNEARTGDTKQLQAGGEHKTIRESWWKSAQTDRLGKWLTSIVFVTNIRAADGKIWSCDRDALKAQMTRLSFDLPADYQW
jgi:hypothetical protein